MQHIDNVLAEIKINFPKYFTKFSKQPLEPAFKKAIDEYEKERNAYRVYMSIQALLEFEDDPNAFKSHTRKNCPIIRRCLNSPDEVMRQYQKSFSFVTGRQILDTVHHIASFGLDYVADFNDERHEDISTYQDLGLEPLNEDRFFTLGVIGYGVQSSLLYGLYARNFAHRSQNAVWSLYFLSGKKEFDLQDGSEFLMAQPDRGTCEQNFFYPAELFGFYGVQIFKLLRSACAEKGITFYDRHRYTYLSLFSDFVADLHRDDINCFTRSSEYVESRPWF
jgi:hypothetical protein